MDKLIGIMTNASTLFESGVDTVRQVCSYDSPQVHEKLQQEIPAFFTKATGEFFPMTLVAENRSTMIFAHRDSKRILIIKLQYDPSEDAPIVSLIPPDTWSQRYSGDPMRHVSVALTEIGQHQSAVVGHSVDQQCSKSSPCFHMGFKLILENGTTLYPRYADGPFIGNLLLKLELGVPKHFQQYIGQ